MGIESGSTNRWRTARERDRLKARYTIQNRLLSHVNDNTKNDDVCNNTTTTSKFISVDELNIILQYLQKVIKNDISSFSVVALSRHGYLLNVPLPNVEDYKYKSCSQAKNAELSSDDNSSKYEKVLSSLSIMLSTIIPYSTQAIKLEATNQPAGLALSKFGVDYTTTRLIPYMEHLKQYKQRQLTIIEYASLLGRHGIVGQLLLGGIDPTMNDSNTQASRKVLSLLHSLGEDKTTSCNKIPLSIWSYIIRAVIEMRMNGLLDRTTATDDLGEEGSDIAYCSICNTKQEHTLEFGSPCHHTYCESCMWFHLVEQLSSQNVGLERNIVTCPICNEEFQGFKCQHQNEQKIGAHLDISMAEEKSNDTIMLSIEIRQQRKRESLDKFMKLPLTSSDLIKSSKKKKRNKDLAYGTWQAALQPFIETQQSREVRLDRFFKALMSSPHLVAAYLEAGIHVDTWNVYGQSPLYLACWKGSCVVVKLLLDYGADTKITANGGSSCYSIAKRHSRNDVLDLLERYAGKNDSLNTLHINKAITVNNSHNCQVSVLIDSSKDHPGAGSYIVDNAITEEELCYLDSLWKSLPIVDTCDEVDEQYTGATVSKNEHRPSRRYFCDAEEEIQQMLKGCVQAARKVSIKECNSESSSTASSTVVKDSPSSVFKHIRFLTYEKPGGVLPPHVDLCRVEDASGVRSTHTFILYLTDCDHGGGTALLESLKDPQVIAVAQPKRGRAIIFPHGCPHSGLEVSVVPKVLLRGEVIL